MQKYFNRTGYCNPEWHYVVDPLRGTKEKIKGHLQRNEYFVIHAPRQTGKTTLLHSLAKELNKEGEYISVVFSVETAGYRSITEDKANEKINEALYLQSKQFVLENERPKAEKHDQTFKKYLTEWADNQKKPIVLLIDEVDALYDDVLVSILRQLRDGFQLRPNSFPASIALVGLRDVRDYKLKVRQQDASLGSGSPFNIKAESFRLENFTHKQVKNLLLQHTEETGQIFADEVIDKIYDYTDGQPWLTNAMAYEIVDRILEGDYTKKIKIEMVDEAKEHLILRKDTHLDSLIDKLQDTRVGPIVKAIITGDDIVDDNYNESIQYTIDLGIVKRSSAGIVISNKIYNEIIPRVLNLSFQDSLQSKVQTQWFIKPTGKLDMDTLLKEFQKFYRRHSESWIERFNYKEAGHQLLLMAFLQRVLNGGGQIEREMAVGNMRTDLAIYFKNEVFILELKINRDQFTLEDGLVQISRYMDKLGQKHGYLILFEPKPSTEIAWEERLKWSDTEHEHLGVKRKITLVEM